MSDSTAEQCVQEHPLMFYRAAGSWDEEGNLEWSYLHYCPICGKYRVKRDV